MESFDVAEGVDIYDLVRAEDTSHLLEPILTATAEAVAPAEWIAEVTGM